MKEKTKIFKRISSEILYREGHFAPQVFCGEAGLVFAATNLRYMNQLGIECIEGARKESLDQTNLPAPMVRPKNLGCLRFEFTPDQMAPPTEERKRCAIPGDVVVSKLLPIKASWATRNVIRHPVDANCLIIRGLSKPWGLWVALHLNHWAYEAYFFRRGGAAIIPRIGLKDLCQTPIADLHPEAEALSWKLEELLDEESLLRQTFFRRQQEVERLVDENQAVQSWRKMKARFANVQKCDFYRPQEIGDSWLPQQVASSRFQTAMQGNDDWEPMSALLSFQSNSQARFRDFSLHGRILRLKDVAISFAPVIGVWEELPEALFRLYRDPVRDGEVLLSLLATSPRVTYAVGPFPEPVHIVDHWARLSFRETPGAWALLLNTPVVAEQMALLASGSSRQFIRIQDLGKISLPIVALEIRRQWEEQIRRDMRKRSDLEQQFQKLLARAWELFDEAHPVLQKRRSS
ncbi:MAG: hypothetical protein WA705_22370 [Candidatus Ozemobacteraceae bacterium]